MVIGRLPRLITESEIWYIMFGIKTIDNYNLIIPRNDRFNLRGETNSLSCKKAREVRKYLVGKLFVVQRSRCLSTYGSIR